MPLGRNDLHVLHPNPAQFAGHKLGGLLHIRLVFLKRADTGNAKKIFQFTDEPLLILTGKIHCWRSHNESFLARARFLAFNSLRKARVSHSIALFAIEWGRCCTFLLSWSE